MFIDQAAASPGKSQSGPARQFPPCWVSLRNVKGGIAVGQYRDLLAV